MTLASFFSFSLCMKQTQLKLDLWLDLFYLLLFLSVGLGIIFEWFIDGHMLWTHYVYNLLWCMKIFIFVPDTKLYAIAHWSVLQVTWVWGPNQSLLLLVYPCTYLLTSISSWRSKGEWLDFATSKVIYNSNILWNVSFKCSQSLVVGFFAYLFLAIASSHLIPSGFCTFIMSLLWYSHSSAQTSLNRTSLSMAVSRQEDFEHGSAVSHWLVETERQRREKFFKPSSLACSPTFSYPLS